MSGTGDADAMDDVPQDQKAQGNRGNKDPNDVWKLFYDNADAFADTFNEITEEEADAIVNKFKGMDSNWAEAFLDENDKDRAMTLWGNIDKDTRM